MNRNFTNYLEMRMMIIRSQANLASNYCSTGLRHRLKIQCHETLLNLQESRIWDQADFGRFEHLRRD